MSGEPEHRTVIPTKCPTVIATVLAYTAEVTAARPWGIVTGSGSTPEEALKNLRDEAKKQGREVFKRIWDDEAKERQQKLDDEAKKQSQPVFKRLRKRGSGPKSQWQKKMETLITEASKDENKDDKLKGTFIVGSTRLAYSQKNEKPCWIAYGTLLADNTGDGFNWLKWLRKPNGQAQGQAGQGSGDGSGVK
jgi:hypothetical protein